MFEMPFCQAFATLLLRCNDAGVRSCKSHKGLHIRWLSLTSLGIVRVLQVLTLQQTAENLVFAYPHIGSMEVMLDVLARQRGEPQKDEIVAEAQINPMQAEWKRLIQYHDLLGTGMYPDYLPLATCPVESHMA